MTILMRAATLLFFSSFPLAVTHAQDRAGIGTRLLSDPRVRAALDAAARNEPGTIEDQIRLSEIPAPPFKEEKRGLAVKAIFEQLGLQNVRIDKAGNVLGDRPGSSPRPHLVLAAHLDTVFPEGTNVKTTREGTVVKGAGIGDDARGLAVLIATVRAMQEAKVQTRGSITFVANVGEEGLGDLRGVKQLFNETLKGTIDRFVSIDGTGLGITNTAVGSLRYKVSFSGPGGHSYGAFGLANPIHALGRAIARISDFEVPKEPKTTFNVGRIGGGTSVNSIAFESWMEVDMRSADIDSLRAVDQKFHAAVEQALAAENAFWHDRGKLSVKVELLGERPAGNTPESSPIVQIALSVTQALGFNAKLGAGSTDSNVPMSLKIPAVTIGGGGRGEGAHSLGESFDTRDSAQGTQRALLLAIALVQE